MKVSLLTREAFEARIFEVSKVPKSMLTRWWATFSDTSSTLSRLDLLCSEYLVDGEVSLFLGCLLTRDKDLF